MKKTGILFSLFTLLLVGSCKKDNTLPDIDTPTVTPHPDGYLRNQQTFSILSDTVLQKKYAPAAYFYSDSTASDIIAIDSVALNGVPLKAGTNNIHYTNDPIPGADGNWYLKWKNGTPILNYKSIMPSFASYNLIPDSINLSQDLTIPVPDVLNSTKSSIRLTDNIGQTIYKEFKPGDTKVTFTAAELAYLHRSPNFYLYISLYNKETKWVSGKRLYFENRLMLDKYLLSN